MALPLNEGTRPGQEVAQGAEHAPFSPAPGALLGDYAQDYAFFAHAAFYTYGGLDVDVLEQFVLEHPGDPAVSVYRFDMPIFSGLSRHPACAAWDYALGIVPRVFWPSLYDFLRAVSIVDRTRGTYAVATVHELEIPDPLVFRRATLPSPVPAVKVTAFGLDGNRFRVEFLSRCAWPGGATQVVRLPPDPKTIKLADAILSHDPTPYRAIESEVRLESDFRPPAGL